MKRCYFLFFIFLLLLWSVCGCFQLLAKLWWTETGAGGGQVFLSPLWLSEESEFL